MPWEILNLEAMCRVGRAGFCRDGAAGVIRAVVEAEPAVCVVLNMFTMTPTQLQAPMQLYAAVLLEVKHLT